MEISDILKEDRCVVADTIFTGVRVGVFLVSRTSFNDERLIESRSISLEELRDRPLQWFDPYLGKFQGSRTRIAFVRFEDDEVTFLEETEGKLYLRQKISYLSYCYTEDYDKGHIIAVHIK